jgi:hypothetical protein
MIGSAPISSDPSSKISPSGGPPLRIDGDRVVEHAIQMSGGSMQVHNANPDIDRIFPLADWIKANQRGGGRVWRRVVVVVEDWEEVPRDGR